MSIEFHCQQCNKLLRTTPDRAGQTARCPDCGATVAVPGGNPGYGSVYSNPDGIGGGYRPCPMCGEPVRDVAVKCRHCGESIGGATGGPVMSQRTHLAPHRGGLILAFGILSWAVCLVFGAIAWSMGNTDLAEMDAGRMDPEGRSMTQAGKIVGMVHCVVFLVAIAILVLVMIVGGIAAVA